MVALRQSKALERVKFRKFHPVVEQGALKFPRFQQSVRLETQQQLQVRVSKPVEA
jgi:hypothetical protein